jgi:hypothetical protein
MLPNDTTPIPSTTREALEDIETASAPSDGIARDEAVRTLTANGYSEAEAREHVSILLDRGYLYAVGDELRITPDLA